MADDSAGETVQVQPSVQEAGVLPVQEAPVQQIGEVAAKEMEEMVDAGLAAQSAAPDSDRARTALEKIAGPVELVAQRLIDEEVRKALSSSGLPSEKAEQIWEQMGGRFRRRLGELLVSGDPEDRALGLDVRLAALQIEKDKLLQEGAFDPVQNITNRRLSEIERAIKTLDEERAAIKTEGGETIPNQLVAVAKKLSGEDIDNSGQALEAIKKVLEEAIDDPAKRDELRGIFEGSETDWEQFEEILHGVRLRKKQVVGAVKKKEYQKKIRVGGMIALLMTVLLIWRAKGQGQRG